MKIMELQKEAYEGHRMGRSHSGARRPQPDTPQYSGSACRSGSGEDLAHPGIDILAD